MEHTGTSPGGAVYPATLSYYHPVAAWKCMRILTISFPFTENKLPLLILGFGSFWR